MKHLRSKLLSILLVLCMMVQYVPGVLTVVRADEMHEAYGVDTVESAPDAALPGNDDLFAMYVERTLYDWDWAAFGTAARENLNTAEQGIYDALKAEIEKVAAGGGSAEFVFESVPGLKMEWTREELGVESIEDVTEAKAQFAVQFSLNRIFSALLSDCPYDLYWYDKTVGGSMGYSMSRSGMSSGGTTYWTKLTFKNLTFKMNVASAYQGDADFTVTTDVAKVTTAKVNAQDIVDANASGTDYEKLAAYKTAICDLVSYNDEAADDSYTGGYGDPWQLIYVFDGDDATEVVCEGYAKAFQYLCDLGGLDCICVSGVMSGGTGAGGHMWNIVTLDGANYLVDVTNCDEGTIGAPDALFLVGNADGSVADGYTFSIGGQKIAFVYDDDILDTWTEEELVLSAADYDPEAQVPAAFGVSVTETGSVGGNPRLENEDVAICGQTYTNRVKMGVDAFYTDVVRVTVDGAELVRGSDYTYDRQTAALTISGEKITGPIEIFAQVNAAVTFDLNGGDLAEDVKAEMAADGLTVTDGKVTVPTAYGVPCTFDTTPENLSQTFIRDGYTCVGLKNGEEDADLDAPAVNCTLTVQWQCLHETTEAIDNADGTHNILCANGCVAAENIAHSYADGLCVCGAGIVRNTATGANYGTLAAALRAAKEAETLQLQADCAEARIMVTAGVTLDLNGHDLTADYLVAFDSAHVIDGAGAGSLITAQQNVVLDEDNGMIPVYDSGAYVFTKAAFAVRRDMAYTGAGIKVDSVACPVRMDVVELLKNGSTDNNLQIMILLSWDTDEGTGSQKFLFSDEIVAAVYSSNNGSWGGYSKMFSMVITGFDTIKNLRADMMIVSGTDAAYISANGIEIG